MRLLVTFIAALSLCALPAAAGAGGSGAEGSSAANTTAASSAAAQPSNTPAPKAEPAATPAAMETELQELRDLIEAQSKQIQEQNEQLKEQQVKMQALEDKVDSSSSSGSSSLAAAPAAAASANASSGTGLIERSAGTDDPIGSKRSVSLSPNANGYGNMDVVEQPASIHYKGIELTPGGFMAAETVWRQKALGSDVNSSLNATPFDGQSQAHMDEFFGSGRQSRIAMLVEGKLDNVKIGGYYEADFLSAGTTSNSNQSNSYTFRQRQFWGQAAFSNGWTFTGGQQWSLVTETLHGMDNRTEALPLTIDAQYNAGFSWARQYGFRITKNFANKMWLGLAVENAQINAATVHGNPTVVSGGTEVVTCTAVTAGVCTTSATGVVNQTTTNNYLFGTFGISGGLYNPAANYSFNPTPDFIVKAVFEPGFGHYEVFGLVTEMRNRVFPCADGGGTVFPAGVTGVTNSAPPASAPCPAGAAVNSAAGAFNTSAVAGGGGGNARWSVLSKKVDLGVHFFGGEGIGRYGSVGLADATVKPNGSVVPLHNFQMLGTLQFHPTSRWDIYFDYGDEYEGRATYVNTFNGNKPQGYGGFPVLNIPGGGTTSGLFADSGCDTEIQPEAGAATTSLGVPTGLGGTTGFIPGSLANCTGDTRNFIEGTGGFWYRFYQGPRGRVQFGMQYSALYRQAWGGTHGTVGALGLTGPLNGVAHSFDSMWFTSFRYYLP